MAWPKKIQDVPGKILSAGNLLECKMINLCTMRTEGRGEGRGRPCAVAGHCQENVFRTPRHFLLKDHIFSSISKDFICPQESDTTEET